MTLSRLELGFESPWGRHASSPHLAAFLLTTSLVSPIYNGETTIFHIFVTFI